jgi:GntR family transcriptional regulator, rspAB operon transcriptional repressor
LTAQERLHPTTQKRSAQTAEHVFQRLLAAILQGKLEGGKPLREAALARQWNVSRTPLREAVRRVSESGLLSLRANQAPLIRPISVDDVRTLYDLREVLEVHALHRAWPQLVGRSSEKMLTLAQRVAPSQPGWQQRSLKFDLALHLWWTDLCGNPWLKSDLGRHYNFLRIFQRWVGRDLEALRVGYQEHRLILTAIHDGDQDRASAALQNHIRSSAQLVEIALRRSQSVS